MGLVGNYNPENRITQIQTNLKDRLEEAKKNLRKKYSTDSTKDQASKGENNGDLLKMEIDCYSQEVQKFEDDVKAYEGPHFKKAYRSLTQRSGELQCDLDKIDHQQRDDIRKDKKNLICKVDQTVTILKGKVHRDGQLCSDCKVSVI